MNGAANVVLFLAFVAAFIAWAVAVLAALAVVRLAPPGQKLSAYVQLGWWRFAALEQRVGPAVRPHIRRYKLAFYGFFGIILVVMLMTIAVLHAKP